MRYEPTPEGCAALEADGRRHLAFWVLALYLQEWAIELEVHEVPDEEDKATSAVTRIDRQLRHAVIRLWWDHWSGERPHDGWGGPQYQDLEEVVVHELLHIRKNAMDAYIDAAMEAAGGTLMRHSYGEEEEVFLDLLARALVSLTRTP